MFISLSDINHLWLGNYEMKTEVICLYPVFFLGEQLKNSLPREGNYAADYVC